MRNLKQEQELAKVELQPAYAWDCPNCGSQQFARAIVVELTPEDQEDLQDRYGGDASAYETGHWMGKPEEVRCSECGEAFATVDWGEE